MENFRFSLFDLFAHTLPGAVLLLAGILFFDTSVTIVADTWKVFQEMNLSTGIGFIITSYIVGFIMDVPSAWVFSLVLRIAGTTQDTRIHLPSQFQRVLIRHYSPNNFIFVHTWRALKTMSQSLSISIFILGVSFIQKGRMYPNNAMSWFVLIMLCVLSSIILIRKSYKYDVWHFRDLTDIVDTLRLEERVQRDLRDPEQDIRDMLLLEGLLNAGRTLNQKPSSTQPPPVQQP